MPLRLDGSKRTVRGCEVGRGCNKKKERGAKRENRAFSVFWLERNPRGNENREGVRG